MKQQQERKRESEKNKSIERFLEKKDETSPIKRGADNLKQKKGKKKKT